MSTNVDLTLLTLVAAEQREPVRSAIVPLMDSQNDPAFELSSLRERAKELKCMYDVISALSRRDELPQVVFASVLQAIPPAWQYPDITTARIEYFGRTHALPDFEETPWRQHSPISIWRTRVGSLEVLYKEERPAAWEGPFLLEERQLLDSIAQRVGEYLEWKQRELGGERLGAAPEHWQWRQRFAERIAGAIDPQRFGVRDVYLFGSTEMGNAGVGSDIDLMIVFEGDPKQETDLRLWLEGWSLALAEVGFQLYGLPSRGLLDVHFVRPEEAGAKLRSSAISGHALRALPLGVPEVKGT